MNKVNKKIDKSLLVSVIKGTLISVAISLIGILFFAFIIKLFGLTDGWIKPVNQLIKAVSVFVGVFFALKKDKEKGLIKGMIIGLSYTFFAFVVFSILNGAFNVDKSLLTDILFGGITGAICGIIAGNLKGKKYAKI